MPRRLRAAGLLSSGPHGRAAGCGVRRHVRESFTLLRSLPMTQTRAARHRTVLATLLIALIAAVLTPARAEAASLQEVTGFGSNPGALRMFRYVPDGLPAGRPVVVALHGCTQDASGYGTGSGWLQLADRWGFSVVLPQQQSANNASNCFDWFQSGDIERGQGEAASVAQMVDRQLADVGGDTSRVYVTGLSMRRWHDRRDDGGLPGEVRRGRDRRRAAVRVRAGRRVAVCVHVRRCHADGETVGRPGAGRRAGLHRPLAHAHRLPGNGRLHRQARQHDRPDEAVDRCARGRPDRGRQRHRHAAIPTRSSGARQGAPSSRRTASPAWVTGSRWTPAAAPRSAVPPGPTSSM